MPIALLQVSYRPVRVAWLVRPRSVRDLQEAVRLSSCLWGGSFGLIVDAGLPAEELDEALRRFRIDVLHAVSQTGEAEAVVSRHPELEWPITGDGIVQTDQRKELGLLDLRHALRLWEPKKISIIPGWDPADRYALVYAATFGDLNHPVFGAAQLRAYADATSAVAVDAEHVADEYWRYETPARAAASGLDGLVPRNLAEDVPTVFVGTASSLRHLRGYWNCRATGNGVVFWDSNEPGGGPFQAEVIRRIEAAARAQQDRPENFRLFNCYVAARRGRRPEIPFLLRQAIENFGLHPSITPIVGELGSAAWLYRGLPNLPSTPDERVVAHAQDRGEMASQLTIELPPTPLLNRRMWSRQTLAVQIETYADYGYRGTLKLPFLPDLNPWYRWQMSSALEHVRVQDDAFSLLTSHLGTTLDISSLPRPVLLRKIFERAGIEAARSLPGEAASHLLAQFGGYQGLGPLRLPGVRKLLSLPSARRGILRRAAEDVINDQGRFAQAEISWLRGGHRATPRDVWDFLVRQQIFLPGLETTCPSCQHSSFYRPRELGDDLQCPRCGREFPLGPAISGDPVRFRVSGLLEPSPERSPTPAPQEDRDGPTSQPAAVPVLLTMLFLMEWLAGYEGQILDTSYELRGDHIQPCESDLIAVVYGPRQETHTHVLIGECKGRGQVEADDVRKLTAAARALEATAGVRCDVLFSTTRNAFTDEELELFRRYYEDSSDHHLLRRAPVLLTSGALDWSIHSKSSLVRQADRFGGSGFETLVRWSTKELIGDEDLPVAVLREPPETSQRSH